MPPFAAHLEPAGRSPSRRDWLRIGVPMAFSCLTPPSPAVSARPVARPSSLPGFGRAKSVLVIFTSGGQSQLDTWDPKPTAPEEVRGAFGTTATKVPGVRVCEHLPRLAALADRYTIVRSMTHDDLDHGSACYLALTGQFHPQKSSNPPPRATDAPALSAVLHRLRPTDRFPHSAFHVNGPVIVPQDLAAGQFGGYLGHGYDPVNLGDVTRGTALLGGMTLPPDVPSFRLGSRRELLARMEAASGANAHLPGAASQVGLARKAFELMNAPRTQAAFDLEQEPAAVRDRYGRYRAGQACLMGRRLVEAGVPWVTVFFNHSIRGQDDHADDTDQYGWDTHNDIFQDMRTHLLPRFDRTVSVLLEDLEQRGLLDQTLVAIMGEFGRAPVVAVEKNFTGSSPGRKHWAACYSLVLAGAGIRRGAVFGQSDRQAGYPALNPVAPGDLAATLFYALGIDANAHFEDLLGRPQRIVTGDPVLKLFG